MRKEPEVRTVRELSGEIWSEVRGRFSDEEIDWRVQDRLADVVMGILARHAGKLIENDRDLPVVPLPALDSAGACQTEEQKPESGADTGDQ